MGADHGTQQTTYDPDTVNTNIAMVNPPFLRGKSTGHDFASLVYLEVSVFGEVNYS